jgi:hypothetical protein
MPLRTEAASSPGVTWLPLALVPAVRAATPGCAAKQPDVATCLFQHRAIGFANSEIQARPQTAICPCTACERKIVTPTMVWSNVPAICDRSETWAPPRVRQEPRDGMRVAQMR